MRWRQGKELEIPVGNVSAFTLHTASSLRYKIIKDHFVVHYTYYPVGRPSVLLNIILGGFPGLGVNLFR